MRKKVFIGILWACCVLPATLFAQTEQATVQVTYGTITKTFADGDVSTEKFCFGDSREFLFDAQVSDPAWTIQRVNWDFGDGITQLNGHASVTHTYTTPAWFIIRADIYCKQGSTTKQYKVEFSIPIVEPQTSYVYRHACKEVGYTGSLKNDTLPEAEPTDCSKRVDTVVIYGVSSVHQDEISAVDSYYEPLNGQTYTYTSDIELNLTELLNIKNSTECDTIIHRHIIISSCLEVYVSMPPTSICKGNQLIAFYQIMRGEMGDIYFVWNGQKTRLIAENNQLSLPVANLKPGNYDAVLQFKDTYCNQMVGQPIQFTILYPADIIKYKFNNVLSVYLPGHGGNEGYEFKAYQWYKNGEPIDGATGATYYQEEPFQLGDRFSVLLTDKNGVTLPSCEKVIDNVPTYTTAEPQLLPSKVIRDKHLYIRLDNRLYDFFGQRVK
jgi:hypothetical protein